MRILIAEDEKDLRDQYQEFLEKNNHSVSTSNDGAACLELYYDEHKKWSNLSENDETNSDSPFDAVILDYQMPKKKRLRGCKRNFGSVPKTTYYLCLWLCRRYSKRFN